MKTILTLLLLAATCQAQTKKPDWKPCTDITAQWAATVAKFNAEYKVSGFQIQLECTYSNPSKRLPERHYPLTRGEITALNDLRKSVYTAAQAESDYEDYLLRIHDLTPPDYGDKCWHYVGIQVGADYITEDPNPMYPGCTVKP